MLALSKRWPEPERAYREWHRNRAKNDFGLGAVQLVQVKPDTHVANMIGQRGTRTGSNGPPVRYEAIERCLVALAGHATSWGRACTCLASGAGWPAGGGSGLSRSSWKPC